MWDEGKISFGEERKREYQREGRRNKDNLSLTHRDQYTSRHPSHKIRQILIIGSYGGYLLTQGWAIIYPEGPRWVLDLDKWAGQVVQGSEVN